MVVDLSTTVAAGDRGQDQAEAEAARAVAGILRYPVGMPEGYRVIEVTTPAGTFSKRTAQPVAVVSVYRATKPFRTAGRMVKAGELFAVWSSGAAATA